MAESIATQVTRLQSMTVGELRDRYAEVFGEQPRSRNKDYLWKRVAFRIQELTEGGISERARRRAEQLARDADLRVRAPEGAAGAPSAPPAMPRDPRLPPAGSTLKRLFNGKEHLVRVLDSGFEYEGRTFESLSAVARTIAGTRWNGFLFFNLGDIDGRGR
jgi:hypothetical protein